MAVRDDSLLPPTVPIIDEAAESALDNELASVGILGGVNAPSAKKSYLQYRELVGGPMHSTYNAWLHATLAEIMEYRAGKRHLKLKDGALHFYVKEN